MEINDSVAGFAAIVIGSGSELIVVWILVAIEAGFKLNYVDGVLACRDMAFGAFYFYVHTFQWIGRRIVLFHSE